MIELVQKLLLNKLFIKNFQKNYELLGKYGSCTRTAI